MQDTKLDPFNPNFVFCDIFYLVRNITHTTLACKGMEYERASTNLGGHEAADDGTLTGKQQAVVTVLAVVVKTHNCHRSSSSS